MRDPALPPLVSIILLVHGAPALLEASLASIRTQSCGRWDLLAIDDGTNPAGSQVVEHAAQTDPRIRIVKATGSPPALRNRGASLAHAPLLAFVEAGDLWAASRLTDHLALHRARKGLTGSYARLAFIAPTASVLVGARRHSRLRRDPLTALDVLIGDPACTLRNAVVSRQAMLVLGGYDETLAHAQDHDLLARMIRHGARIEGIDAVLTGHRPAACLPVPPGRMQAAWRQVILRHCEGREARRLEALHCRLIARRVLGSGERIVHALPAAWRGMRIDARSFCGGWRASGGLALACLATLALPPRLRRRLLTR
jgi:hypothetical protein